MVFTTESPTLLAPKVPSDFFRGDVIPSKSIGNPEQQNQQNNIFSLQDPQFSTLDIYISSIGSFLHPHLINYPDSYNNFISFLRPISEYSAFLEKNTAFDTSTTSMIEAKKQNFLGFKAWLQTFRDINGNTPLILAAKENKFDQVQLLTNNMEIDSNTQNYKGETALFYAVYNCNEAMVEFLLQSGSKPNIQNIDSTTALFYSVVSGNQNICSSLLKYGASVHILDDESENCLHWAVRENNLDMVTFIVNVGGDIFQKNEDGEDCVELSCSLFSCKENKVAQYFFSIFKNHNITYENDYFSNQSSFENNCKLYRNTGE